MKNLVFLLTFLFSTPCFAQWHLLEPRDVYIDTYHNDVVHDSYLAPDDATLGYGASFNTNFDVIKYNGYGLYWDNNLHFDQDDTGQVRAAGWQYSLNLVIFRMDDKTKLEVFKQHHSQHIMDRTRPEHFPVYDRYGVRFVIFERQNK
jgi:hypothetical protein